MGEPQIAADPGGLKKEFLTNFALIGEARAEMILDHFGEDLPRIMPDREAVETELVPLLAKQLPNLGPRIAWAMFEAWPAFEAECACMFWLSDNGVDKHQAGAARRILKLLGDKAFEVLTTNPYVLVSVLPWKNADQIGLRTLARQCRRDGSRLDLDGAAKAPERLLGAVERAWSDLRQEGHTATVFGDLRTSLTKFLGDPALAENALALGLRKRRIVAEYGVLRPPGCRYMEDRIRSRLESWMSERRHDVADIDHAVDTVGDRHSLHAEQRDAIRFVLNRRVSAIAGSAGTGKSTTARALIEAWESLTGGNVVMATLSGKAALVLSRKTGKLARTIFRLLREFREMEERSVDPESQMLSDDIVLNENTLIIIDEASMPSLGDWCEIVDWADRRGASLCLLGDAGQLPPIGPGIVFHTMSSNERYCTHLRTIHRQAAASGIPQVAKELRQGKTKRLAIDWPAYSGRADGVSLLECPSKQALNMVAEVVGDLGGFPAEGHSLQVIAALNRTVAALNDRFHLANRNDRSAVRGVLRDQFAVGDPVVHTVNDYQRGLFNGLLGYVADIDTKNWSVTCVFDDEIHSFKGDTLANISLAYALTAHKLQGSQAERVVVVIENSRRLMEPTWVYTAVTRAEKQVVLVGERAHLAQALARQPAFRKRRVGFNLGESDDSSRSAASEAQRLYTGHLCLGGQQTHDEIYK